MAWFSTPPLRILETSLNKILYFENPSKTSYWKKGGACGFGNERCVTSFIFGNNDISPLGGFWLSLTCL